MQIQQHDDRWVISVTKQHTLYNIIRKALWETGAEAGYDRGHPNVGEATLVVRDDDPYQAIEKAISKVKNDLRELRAEVEQQDFS